MSIAISDNARAIEAVNELLKLVHKAHKFAEAKKFDLDRKTTIWAPLANDWKRWFAKLNAALPGDVPPILDQFFQAMPTGAGVGMHQNADQWHHYENALYGATVAALDTLKKSIPLDGTPDEVPIRNTQSLHEPLIKAAHRNYKIGTETVVVEKNEDTVLKAFFDEAATEPKWVCLQYKELRRRCVNLEHAPKILGDMKHKYPLLAHVIDCPGVRGKGGLKVFLAKNQGKQRK